MEGAIAQLVEHRTENPGVPGSIPGGTTNQKQILRNFAWDLFFQELQLESLLSKLEGIK